jgi:hypothetical protein
VTFPDSLAWTVLTTTQDFSVFAGVLAGFVFLAMVDYAKPGPVRVDPERSKADQLPLMVGAFFSFVVAAFLFAVLHGDGRQPQANQFVQATCPTAALAIGVVQLAVSLVSGLREQPRASGAAELVAYATIVIAIVFFTGIVVSPLFQATQLDLTSPYLPILWQPVVWVGAMLLMAFPILILLLARRAGSSALPRYLRYLQIHLSIAIGVVAAIALNVMTGASDLSIVYTHAAGLIAIGVMLIVVGVPIAALALQVHPQSRVHRVGSNPAST